MTLDIGDLVGVHSRVRECLPQNRRLGGGARCQEAVGAAVRVDGRAFHNASDTAAVAQGSVQSLHYEDPTSLAANIAVCPVVEDFAAAIVGHCTGMAEREPTSG